MWSLIMSKTGAVLAISAVVLILVGVLFFKNTHLKSQLAECSANVTILTNDLQKAQLAVDETKKSLELRESEIKVTQAQVLAGNKAVQEYKARIDKTNEILSLNRAKEVMAFLVGKGVQENQLVAVGYGEKKPIATNDTEAGRAKNRRTEFVIKKM